jgi:hypothetical protein
MAKDKNTDSEPMHKFDPLQGAKRMLNIKIDELKALQEVNNLLNNKITALEAQLANATLSDNGKEYPILTSMGIHQAPDGGWSFYTIKTQNLKVIEISANQGQMRSTAIDEFKVAAFKEFMND